MIIKTHATLQDIENFYWEVKYFTCNTKSKCWKCITQKKVYLPDKEISWIRLVGLFQIQEPYGPVVCYLSKLEILR